MSKDPKSSHVHAYVDGMCRCGKNPYQVEGELRLLIDKLTEQLATQTVSEKHG